MDTHKPPVRADYAKIHQFIPETPTALRSIGEAVGKSELEPSLIELLHLRASQINGCAFCLNMHSVEAQKHGETTERIQLLMAWREAPVFTDRERAALAWTEAITLVSESHIPDEVYEEVSRHFSEKELAQLTSSIVVINAWNRLAIAYRWAPQIKSNS